MRRQPNLFDSRKTVIITGASSGLGRTTAAVLAKSGKWFVILVRAPAAVGRHRGGAAAGVHAPRIAMHGGLRNAISAFMAPPRR